MSRRVEMTRCSTAAAAVSMRCWRVAACDCTDISAPRTATTNFTGASYRWRFAVCGLPLRIRQLPTANRQRASARDGPAQPLGLLDQLAEPLGEIRLVLLLGQFLDARRHFDE